MPPAVPVCFCICWSVILRVALMLTADPQVKPLLLFITSTRRLRYKDKPRPRHFTLGQGQKLELELNQD